MTFMQTHNIHTYDVHTDRHNNISEHKTTRINDSHYKLEYKKLLLIRNIV